MRSKYFNSAFILLFFTTCLAFPALSQEVTVKGVFLKDSIKIGEDVEFSLSARYPRNFELVFPDSTFNFFPFEFVTGRYYLTKSDSTLSRDSAVYTLATFEIDSIQYLELPVYIINGKDSVAVNSKMDSVILIQVVKEITEETSFIADNTFYDVPTDFNYPYFLIALAILVFISLVVLLFFGRKIMNQYRKWKLQKNHKKFTALFQSIIRDFENGSSSRSAEDVLSIWKKYMEKLEKTPYTKLTSKEISKKHPESAELSNTLRHIDKSIYSDQHDARLHLQFEFLLSFSTQQHNQRLKEVQHGK
ncbi:MAG: hypothetical protein ACFCUU_16725 [Cyclobacteriaceae bacterium]